MTATTATAAKHRPERERQFTAIGAETFPQTPGKPQECERTDTEHHEVGTHDRGGPMSAIRSLARPLPGALVVTRGREDKQPDHEQH
jgi:hypothetical protein